MPARVQPRFSTLHFPGINWTDWIDRSDGLDWSYRVDWHGHFGSCRPHGPTGPTGSGSSSTTLPTPALGTSGSATASIGSGTISGTSVVYFITDGASVTLPAATTAGQELILIDADTAGTGGGFTINAPSTNTIVDGPASGAGTSATIPTNCILISDGNKKWWVVQRQ